MWDVSLSLSIIYIYIYRCNNYVGCLFILLCCLQTSKVLRFATFCYIMRRRVEIPYRRLGTTYRSHLQGSRSPRGRPVSQTNPKSSGAIYIAVEASSHVYKIVNLKSCLHSRYIYMRCIRYYSITGIYCDYMFRPVNANFKASSRQFLP